MSARAAALLLFLSMGGVGYAATQLNGNNLTARAGERLRSDFASDHPGAIAWRSTAALAHLALGQSQRTEQLAQAELERAQRIGVTRIVIRDLRILGLAKGGTDGIESLTEAVRIGQRYPTRLEYIYALVDLGAALRRANKRESAHEPLREGLELSRRGGATALARAHRLNSPQPVRGRVAFS